MKRLIWNQILAAALGAALLLPTAGAEGLLPRSEGDEAPAGTPAYELTQRGVGFPLSLSGQVAELGEESLTLENDSETGSYQKVILNLDEDTLILDAGTGAALAFDDIQTGETLYAWAGPVMTRSLPPIATARLILCGAENGVTAPTYAEVESVTKTEEGYDVYVTGEIILHLTGETELLPGVDPDGTPLAESVSLEDLVPGTRLLSWYSVVALSMPAQTSPSKVMVFPSGYAGWVSAVGLEVSINGVALDLSGANAARVEENRLMVPVRAVAEALGCTVGWQADTRQVTVEKDGEPVYSFLMGENQATRGEVTVGLVAPAEAVDGVTYMALDDLITLHGLKLERLWFQ